MWQKPRRAQDSKAPEPSTSATGSADSASQSLVSASPLPSLLASSSKGRSCEMEKGGASPRSLQASTHRGSSSSSSLASGFAATDSANGLSWLQAAHAPGPGMPRPPACGAKPRPAAEVPGPGGYNDRISQLPWDSLERPRPRPSPATLRGPEPGSQAHLSELRACARLSTFSVSTLRLFLLGPSGAAVKIFTAAAIE